MSVIFRKDVYRYKTQACKYFVYMEQGIQAKNEEWATQTVERMWSLFFLRRLLEFIGS